jgi:beta-phosphoglucomutase
MHGVIFDMDGVLVLTEDAHFRSWRDAAARHGVRVDHDKFIRMFGRTNPDIIRHWWGDRVSQDFLETVAEEKERAFRELIAHDVPLAPGCVALLRALREHGFALAVGSSAPRENLDLVLDGAGIRGYFEGAVDGSQVERGKPAPDVFLRAADTLGIVPHRCAVIEDAPPGITAAVAAGCVPVGVATTHSVAQLNAAGARHIEPALADLSVATIRSLLP